MVRLPSFLAQAVAAHAARTPDFSMALIKLKEGREKNKTQRQNNEGMLVFEPDW